MSTTLSPLKLPHSQVAHKPVEPLRKFVKSVMSTIRAGQLQPICHVEVVEDVNEAVALY